MGDERKYEKLTLLKTELKEGKVAFAERKKPVKEDVNISCFVTSLQILSTKAPRRTKI